MGGCIFVEQMEETNIDYCQVIHPEKKWIPIESTMTTSSSTNIVGVTGREVGAVYYWNGNFDYESFLNFMEFYNDCLAKGVEKITMYLNSGGGDSVVYYPLLDILNNGPIIVDLVGTCMLQSFAFSLFYYADVEKRFIGVLFGMIHLSEVQLTSKDLQKKGGGFHKTMENIKVEEAEEEKEWRKVALKDKNTYNKYRKGEDIYFNLQEMNEIMSSSPYGTFIK